MSEFAPYISADGISSQDMGDRPRRRHIKKEDQCLTCKGEALVRGKFCAACILSGEDENYLWEQRYRAVHSHNRTT